MTDFEKARDEAFNNWDTSKDAPILSHFQDGADWAYEYVTKKHKLFYEYETEIDQLTKEAEALAASIRDTHYCEFRERGKGPCDVCDSLKRWDAFRGAK